MAPRMQTAGLSGIISGLAILAGFVLFFYSGFTPAVASDPAAEPADSEPASSWSSPFEWRRGDASTEGAGTEAATPVIPPLVSVTPIAVAAADEEQRTASTRVAAVTRKEQARLATAEKERLRLEAAAAEREQDQLGRMLPRQFGQGMRRRLCDVIREYFVVGRVDRRGPVFTELLGRVGRPGSKGDRLDFAIELARLRQKLEGGRLDLAVVDLCIDPDLPHA